MLRIAHVALDLEAGGLERLIADLMRRTDPERFETSLLCTDFLGRHAEGLESVGRLEVVGPQEKWSMLRPGRFAAKIKKMAPDVVHLHSGVWYKGSLAARLAGVRSVVYTDHGRLGPDTRLVRLVDKIAAGRTDVVVAVSDDLKARLRAEIVPESVPVKTIINGIDTALFEPRSPNDALRRELGVTTDRPVIGTVGRLDVIKGYDVAIKAFRLLLDSGTRATFLLVGDGPERANLEALIKEEKLEDSFLMAGWRNDADDIYQLLDVFTLSSHSEGTSVSLLEAMASGVCPVVTAVGGNPDVLGPNLRHLTVPPADPHALAAAWDEALRDTEKRKAQAQVAMARVRAEFDQGTMVRAYEGLYSSLVNSSGQER